MWKYICSNGTCVVMVFGPNEGSKCPGCGEDGQRTTIEQGRVVTDWYSTTIGELWRTNNKPSNGNQT